MPTGTDLMISAVRALGATPLEDTKTHEYRMEIRSSSSTRNYIVSRRKGEYQRWECSCMGWIRHRTCKHLTNMMPSLDRALAGASASPRVSPRIAEPVQARPEPRPEPRPAAPRPAPRPEPSWAADAAARRMWQEAAGDPVTMMAVFQRHLQAAFEAGRRSS